MHRRRFPFWALILGLFVGGAGGLAYAWILNPVEYVRVAPHQLGPEEQRAYILLVSQAYLYDNDLEQARARLEALHLQNPGNAVAVQADSLLAQGGASEDVQALAILAEALGGKAMAVAIFSGTVAPTASANKVEFSPTPITEIASPTFTATPTQAPTSPADTATPTPVPETDLDLVTRYVICQDDYPQGRIEIYVYNSAGQGIPAVRVLVEWDSEQDQFFTGLKPEVESGYADFQMEENRVYTVTLIDLAEPVVGIDSAPCTTESGQQAIPTYQLIFEPPPPTPPDAEDE